MQKSPVQMFTEKIAESSKSPPNWRKTNGILSQIDATNNYVCEVNPANEVWCSNNNSPHTQLNFECPIVNSNKLVK
jgi:hypothetical protein